MEDTKMFLLRAGVSSCYGSRRDSQYIGVKLADIGCVLGRLLLVLSACTSGVQAVQSSHSRSAQPAQTPSGGVQKGPEAFPPLCTACMLGALGSMFSWKVALAEDS